MSQAGYLSTIEFAASRGNLADAVGRVLAWRTAIWSDRAVAVAILLMQLPRKRSLWAPREYVTELAISLFLGYQERQNLVRRAIRRLMGGGWLRAVDKTGRGRRRTFEFWAGEGRPTPSPEEARRASGRLLFGKPRPVQPRPLTAATTAAAGAPEAEGAPELARELRQTAGPTGAGAAPEGAPQLLSQGQQMGSKLLSEKPPMSSGTDAARSAAGHSIGEEHLRALLAAMQKARRRQAQPPGEPGPGPAAASGPSGPAPAPAPAGNDDW